MWGQPPRLSSEASGSVEQALQACIKRIRKIVGFSP
jgi:hypothetical protein